MAELKIKADSGGGTVSFKGPATTTGDAAIQLTLPQNDGDANQYLKTDGSGALSWATVSSDVVGDTSPQLGGNLDVNGKDITGDAIDFHAADGQVIAKLHKTNSSEFYFNNSKKLEVTNTGISVTGNITPSGGIYLGGSGGSNFMNDYEEGTWTPALTYGGNSVSLSSPVGTYVKVGKLICCRCRMQTSSKPSGNNVNVTGLPFTSSNPTGDGNAITGAVYMESCDAHITEGHPVAFGFDNSSGFDIRMSGQTGSGTSSVSDNAKSGTAYMTTICYQTS